MAFNPVLFLQGVPKNVYVAIAAVAVLSASFGAGYLTGGRNEARIQIKEVEKRVYVPVKEIQQVQVRNIERERLLETRLAAANVANQSVRAQLDLVAADNRNLNSRVVSLLNQTITGDPATDPTGVPAGSTTTVTDLTDWAFDATVQYNDVSTRYNALIDWVDEELIQPQRPEQ